MKQYKGKLVKKTTELISRNKEQLKALLKKSKGLNAPKKITSSFEDNIIKYNKGITTDEIKAWVWYKRKKGTPMLNWSKYFIKETPTILTNWVKNGVLFIDNGNYVPFAIFVFGNIYTKLTNLEKEKDTIIKNFGISVYNNHKKILQDNKPTPLSVSNPLVSERPVILAISKYARNTTINEVREESGLILDDDISLQYAFAKWLDTLSKNEIGNNITAYQIKQYYLYGNSKPRDYDPIEWRSVQKYGREIGELLFKKFLHEVVTHKDQLKIDAWYNTNFNAVAYLQYEKVPVSFEVANLFYGKPLTIKKEQRDAIAFMETVGSGILAYDVGVGKTISAIIEIASALQSGKCKRPIVVVPNPTYNNWIKEIKELLKGTKTTLNLWYNLGADYENSIDFTKKINKNTITLLTYEGFQKLGLSDSDSSFNELSNILDQKKEKTDRDNEKQNEKYRELVGVGNKGTIADVDVLGIDYIVIDEAHNFKNIFSEVKSDDDDPKKRFHIKGGKPSSRGLKAFFICNYIQRNYSKNVLLLTATPFTNSPLEIYSMLSLVAYEYMKKWDIYNIKDFFEQYILETIEPVVTTSGKIENKTVVKSFNNRISLQKLINSHINFKTGEEVKIPRPCKINLPKTTIETEKGIKRLPQNEQITTFLKFTEEQQQIQTEINRQAALPVKKDDPGKQLRLMSQSLNNALSPFLYHKTEPLDYTEFVESSPKILYTLKAIKTVKEWHESRNQEVSGQVIYIDRGKEFFPYIKEYLEKELNYKKNQPLKSNPRLKVDEVEFVTGGISNTKKEKIKNAFNEGVCKIIIGTSTIKEGINLQAKSTVLYNLYPNWNPTDIRQLEGRIWRQKNENGYVRIVMPLMENSMDVFVFQKLEEKTSRINDLWAKSERGNVLDEESLDPNEVKFALITEIGVLADFELDQLKTNARNEIAILESNKESLETFVNLELTYKKERNSLIDDFKRQINENPLLFVSNKNQYNIYLGQVLNKTNKDLKHYELNKSELDTIKKATTNYKALKSINIETVSDKELIQAKAKLNRLTKKNYDYSLNYFKDTVSKYKKIKRSLFETRGYNDGTDISVIKDAIDKDLLLAQEEYETVKSPEFYEKLFKQISEKKEKLNLKGGSLKSKVIDFAKLNLLLSYKMEDVDIASCKIPTKENKVISINTSDKKRKLKLAKAKMKMAKAKLLLTA